MSRACCRMDLACDDWVPAADLCRRCRRKRKELVAMRSCPNCAGLLKLSPWPHCPPCTLSAPY